MARSLWRVTEKSIPADCLYANCSVWAHSPPREEGVAAASIKSREATEALQTAGGARASPTGRSHQQKLSLTRKCLKTHSETSLASDHPVRAFRNGTIFAGAATPPLQGGEYARLNSFT